MEVTVEDITLMTQLHGPALDALPDDRSRGAGVDDAGSRPQSPAEQAVELAARAYADQSYCTLRALRSVLAGRRDRDGLRACERLEEICFSVVSKISRALSSAARLDFEPGDPQSDANGAAKVALLLIEESRQAWGVLMRPGRTAGNGAPARFAASLDGIEAGLLRCFPRAFEFVRMGFDTGELSGAAGEIARAMLDATAADKVMPN